ncbi:MAG: hypothetical protein IID37_08210 [Planctomycetes bacterium]|nr:hypothetical protein [Planctomycetota bacterium]
MRLFGLALCAIGMWSGQTDGALLFLMANDGSGAIELAPGETANISIMLTIRDIDSGFAYATIFLDDDDDEAAGPLSVTDLADGFVGSDIFYDRSAFELPADISHDQENEYGLVMGRQDGENWAPGTYTLDRLTITHDGEATSGTIEITLEGGARAPQVFTADFTQYVYCDPPCCDFPPCSNFLESGVGAEDNPFIVNLIPGPPCDGDANGDGIVDPLDSGFVLARFGCEVDAGDPDCDTADQNDDGVVDPLDVGYVAARFGTCE